MMSSDQHVTGKLREIEVTEDLVKQLVPDLNKVCPDTYDKENWREILLDAYDNQIAGVQIVDLGGIWYEVLNFSDSRDTYHCNLSKAENGDIHFSTSFYNGSSCWTEEVEEEMNRLKESGVKL